MSPRLSKSRIQSGRQCHKRLWLELHQPHASQWTASAQARLDEGTRFGDLARDLLGGGTLIAADHRHVEDALAQTAALLALPHDQAPMLFAKAILEGAPIDVFNAGRMQRDFTYIDDIVEGVVRVLATVPPADGDGAPYAVYNIGNHEAVELDRFIATLERLLGRRAIRNLRPMQPGDVRATYASIERLARATGFAPHTPLDEGLARFVDWYRGYYRVGAQA